MRVIRCALTPVDVMPKDLSNLVHPGLPLSERVTGIAVNCYVGMPFEGSERE